MPRNLAGVPLDRFLGLSFPHIDRSELRNLVRDGRVRVNGVPMTTSRPLHRNAVVTVDTDVAPLPYTAPDPHGELAILLDDEGAVALAKPAGVHADPESLDRADPTWRARVRPAPVGDVLRVVQKLDRATSGVLFLAKTLAATRALRAQFRTGAVRVEEEAIVEGCPSEDAFVVEHRLGADRRRTGRRVVDPKEGDPALTEVRVLERFDGFARVCAVPRTHRTHQVRAHLEAAGFPLVVDPVYGRRTSIGLRDLKRGYRPKPGRREVPIVEHSSVHVRLVAFEAEGGMPRRRAEASLPGDFERLLRVLRHHRGLGPVTGASGNGATARPGYEDEERPR